jgi:hypothetical protein
MDFTPFFRVTDWQATLTIMVLLSDSYKLFFT